VLNFDPDRFRRIQNGAMDLAGPLGDAVAEAVARDQLDTLFFLGAGGAAILLGPAVQLLHASSTLPAAVINAAEVVETGHARLGPRSLVVAASRSGTTAETTVALEYVRSKGARTIALTAHADTPVANAADLSLVNFAEDDTSSESFYFQSLVVALSAMQARGEMDDYDKVIAELRIVPELLVDVKQAFEARAAEIAQVIASSDYHIVTGAGSTWPEAFYYAMCILEEMQWIRTRPVHSSDFFHGTLELVEPGVSVILFKGEDATRGLVSRAERFTNEHTDRTLVIDTADLALPGVSARTRSMISPVLLATVLERVNAHLEVLRDHPLTTRRYYRKISY